MTDNVMGPVRLLLTFIIQRWIDRRHFREAERRMRLTARGGRANIDRLTRQGIADDKRKQAAARRLEAIAERPKGRMAQVNYRAEQVGSFASTVATLMRAAVEIQGAWRALRTRETPPQE